MDNNCPPVAFASSALLRSTYDVHVVNVYNSSHLSCHSDVYQQIPYGDMKYDVASGIVVREPLHVKGKIQNSCIIPLFLIVFADVC